MKVKIGAEIKRFFVRIGGWINYYGTQKIKLTYGQSDGSTVDGYTTDGNGY